MEIFHLTLLHIAGKANVVMRGEQKTSAFALEPLADGRDFVACGFLLGREMVESEHHERVGIGQNAFVDRKLVSSLVNALEHSDRVAGGFAGNLLEAERGAVKQL